MAVAARADFVLGARPACPVVTERVALFFHADSTHRRRDAGGRTELVRERRAGRYAANAAACRRDASRFCESVRGEVALYGSADGTRRFIQARCVRPVVRADAARLFSAVEAGCGFPTGRFAVYVAVNTAVVMRDLFRLQKGLRV